MDIGRPVSSCVKKGFWLIRQRTLPISGCTWMQMHVERLKDKWLACRKTIGAQA